MIWWLLGAGVLGVLVFIRFAPSPDARWHQPIEATTDKDGQGYAIRVIDAQADTFKQIHREMLGLQRTQVMVGSVDDGRVTYVTRSAVWGFPDYTTVEQTGDQIRLFARLRFGKSDLGVNAARLQRLITAVQP